MSRVKDTILFLGPIVNQDTDDYAHGERVRHRTYLTAHSVGIIVEVTDDDGVPATYLRELTSPQGGEGVDVELSGCGEGFGNMYYDVADIDDIKVGDLIPNTQYLTSTELV
jgi:hypothetical protein